jgi:hypothetical protein
MLESVLRTVKATLQKSLNPSDRRAKIQDGDFLIGLLQATATSVKNFTLASLRMSACVFLEITIGQSAFNERMATESLLKHAELMLSTLLVELAKTQQLNDAKSLAARLGVESIVGVDGSLVSLWDGLSSEFKGTFATAAIKLHLALDLLAGKVIWHELTSGSVHDSQRFPDVQEGSLYTIDLGYWSLKLFTDIAHAGGFFLSRLKENCSLKIIEVVAGRVSKTMIGRKVSDLKFIKKAGEVVECLAEININDQPVKIRVIGFWDLQEKLYRWYITNLKAPRKAIFQLYRMRWQIELCFKSMKSTFNFDQVPTLSPKTARTLCTLSLCNYVLAMILRAESAKVIKNAGRSLSLLRAASALRAVASKVYRFFQSFSRITFKKLKDMQQSILPVIKSYLDPNYRSRKNSAQELESMLG